MTAETSNARGEWVLVPRVPTQAMQEAFNDWRPTEGNNYAGAQSFGAQERWAFRQRYAAMLASAPPSAPVGVERIAAEIRASLGHGATVSTRRRWAIELEALAQQPAAVDEAMVERAWVAFCESAGSARQGIRAALTAALAAQPGGAE